ncbi:MAG: YHS domain-containing (seleno)protein [Cyclobacteriaceae bacterium]
MKIHFILLTFLFFACGSSEEPKGEIYATDGIAMGGYDPVSYFEQSEAKEGNPEVTSSVNGVTYQFSSTKNKSLFDGNPQKYLPAYGGWCAYAVAKNSVKMEADPTMWQIQDGKLLLFYDDWMTSLTGSLKEEWNTDETGYKVKADENWVEVKDSE